MVIVTDVPEQATARDISVYFSQCGSVLDARVIDQPGSNIAFVYFESAEEIRSAVALSGKKFLGSRIQVLEKKQAPVQQSPIAPGSTAVATTSLNEMARQNPVVVKVENAPVDVKAWFLEK